MKTLSSLLPPVSVDPLDLGVTSMVSIPKWGLQTIEDASFLAGSFLTKLDLMLRQDAMPQALLRARLALLAAEACVTASGRSERAAELRDAVIFLRPEDHPGPAGEIYRGWQQAVRRPLSYLALHRAFPRFQPEEFEAWMRAAPPDGAASPVARAAATLAAVLHDQPKEEALALCLADARLAQGMNWSHVVPLLALGLAPRDLRKTEEPLRLACHAAVAAGAEQAIRLSASLIRKADALRAVASKLRAKASDQALELFLSHDAVTPAMLTHVMSDRAARRFCDRLVSLGVAQEFSGRESFRLYGM